MVLNTFRNSPGSFRNSSAKLTEIPFKEAKGPLNIYIYISADPGLRQGRGGAWDHRRCGACFCWLATTLPSASSDKAPRAQSQHVRVTATLHASNATTLARPQTSRHSPLLLRAFKRAVCQASNLKMPQRLRGSFAQALRPQPSVVKGVQACRLPGVKPLKCLKPSAAASTRHSGHCPLLLRAIKPAVCQASNP